MPSFIPPYEADNVLTGVASMYTQPWELDQDADTLLPAETVELGTAWSSPWRSLGASDSGLEFGFSRKTNQIMIEEQVVQVDEVTESLSFTMTVSLAEDTLETMKLAYGGGTIDVTAAGASQIGKSTLTLSSDMEPLVFGFEVENQFGFWRRYLVPKVKSVADVKTKFARAKDKRMYETAITSLCAPEDVIIVEKTAVATA